MNEWVDVMAAAAAQNLIMIHQSTRERPAPVEVAVVDDGCDINHPLLAGSIVRSNSYQKAEPMLNGRSSHGTQSCGLVAGRSHGKFPGGQGHGVAVLDAIRYNPIVDVSADVAMYKEISRAGARVISNSFGFPGLRSTEAAKLAEEAFTPIERAGGIAIFAAGNEGRAIALNRLPLAANTILVGATGIPDGGNPIRETKLATSNYGPGITVCALAGGAEGGKAVSTSNRGKGDATLDASRDFAYHTDTSGACALVAGVVALMLRANPALKPEDIKTILCSTADKVDPNRWGDRPGAWKRASEVLPLALRDQLDPSLKNSPYSEYYGFGRVNAEGAVREAYRRAGVKL